MTALLLVGSPKMGHAVAGLFHLVLLLVCSSTCSAPSLVAVLRRRPDPGRRRCCGCAAGCCLKSQAAVATGAKVERSRTSRTIHPPILNVLSLLDSEQLWTLACALPLQSIMVFLTSRASPRRILPARILKIFHFFEKEGSKSRHITILMCFPSSFTVRRVVVTLSPSCFTLFALSHSRRGAGHMSKSRSQDHPPTTPSRMMKQGRCCSSGGDRTSARPRRLRFAPGSASKPSVVVAHLLLLLLLLLLSANTVVHGYSDGAGDCPAGRPAIGDAHTDGCGSSRDAAILGRSGSSFDD